MPVTPPAGPIGAALRAQAAREQRPAARRRTADTITDDELDALYDERDQLLATVTRVRAALNEAPLITLDRLAALRHVHAALTTPETRSA